MDCETWWRGRARKARRRARWPRRRRGSPRPPPREALPGTALDWLSAQPSPARQRGRPTRPRSRVIGPSRNEHGLRFEQNSAAPGALLEFATLGNVAAVGRPGGSDWIDL